MAVKIFGHTVSTPAAVAIAVGSAGAIWFAWKQHQDSAASSASSASSIDPVTGLPYSQDDQVDPLTGEAYLAEAQEYGSVSAAEQAVAGESADDLTSAGNSGNAVGSGTGTVSTDVGSGAYASNAAWSQAVTAGLTDLGYTATDVSAALGMYLGGMALTVLADGVASSSIVSAAIAEYGPPPVPPAGGIILPGAPATGSGGTGTGTSTGTGGGTSTGTPAGPVTGSTGGKITTAPSGFRVVSVTGGDNVNLAWTPFKPPAGQGPVTQFVIAYGPTSGSQQYQQTVPAGASSATVAGVGAGSAGKHYFELWADPAPTGGPHAGPVEATTTKT